MESVQAKIGNFGKNIEHVKKENEDQQEQIDKIH